MQQDIQGCLQLPQAGDKLGLQQDQLRRLSQLPLTEVRFDHILHVYHHIADFTHVGTFVPGQRAHLLQCHLLYVCRIVWLEVDGLPLLGEVQVLVKHFLHDVDLVWNDKSVMHDVIHNFNVLGRCLSFRLTVHFLFVLTNRGCKYVARALDLVECLEHRVIDQCILVKMDQIVFLFVAHHLNNCGDQVCEFLHGTALVDELFPLTLLCFAVEITFLFLVFLDKIFLVKQVLG